MPQPGNPACREDPTQAVPPEQWPQLPRNDRGQLDKSCFVYDAAQDRYDRPQGHALPFEKTKPEERGGEQVTKRIYRCLDCVGCPLAEAVCPKRTNTAVPSCATSMKKWRGADGLADGHRSRSKTVQPAAAHRRDDLRSPEVGAMGLRQFLLRGLEKVKTEWRWACTAFNLGKLVARWRDCVLN